MCEVTARLPAQTPVHLLQRISIIIITVMVSAVIQPAERTLRSRAKKRQRVEDDVFVWNWNERSGHLHQVCPSRRSRFERRPAVHQRPAPSRQRRLSAGTIQHGSDGRIEARRSSGRSQTGPHNRKMHALKDREVTLEGQSQDDTVNGTDGRTRSTVARTAAAAESPVRDIHAIGWRTT